MAGQASQLHREPGNGDEAVMWLGYHRGPSQDSFSGLSLPPKPASSTKTTRII